MNSNESCDVTRVTQLQDFKLLHFAESLMLILSISALPFLFFGVARCLKCALFHINIRIIGILHCLCLATHCIGRIIQHSTDLFLWISTLEICEKRQYLQVCLISQSFCTFGTYCSSLTTVFMAIERTLATRLSLKYENKRTNIGVMLVVLQLISSFLLTIGFFTDDHFPDRPVNCAFESKRSWALFAEFLNILANAIGFFQCYRLYNINMKLRLNGALRELSQKYQVEENKSLIRIVMRFTFFDFFFMCLYFFCSCFTFFASSATSSVPEPLFLALFELMYCVPVYAIVVPSLMSMVIKKIQLEKSVKLVATVHVKDDAYFDYFKHQWT